MARIGRNELCPCGSGIKYKRCCLRQQAQAAATPMGQLKISLLAEIERIQAAAREGEEAVRELGVFIFWSTRGGDAWLLEITENDAVQVADAGGALAVPIDENPETIAINWSHTFAIRERKLFVTAYEDKKETCLESAPTQRINAAVRRIRKKYPPELLRQVHVSEEQNGGAA